METTVSYKKWQFKVDITRTKEIYSNPALKGSSEVCKCNPCKNFVLNRNQIYPREFIKLLNDLGIDKNKESEIYHMCKLEDGFHLYGGWFHFKGEIIEGEDCKIEYKNGGGSFKSFEINENFRVSFFKDAALNYFDKGESDSLIQVEFIAYSKWVIDRNLEPE
ncbi:hypothetical protein [Aureispira anguillae]|uniref:Uncharacterized protein n=1 Tax=Aureispira anguillae TaxID=2864201 RepID=A0A916DPH7_9BACT|nr:hypothetical protein [Aureispira anguillae]BDS10539.1 hypothetical protein AsAng_0012470 [Aureispira anguillae]